MLNGAKVCLCTLAHTLVSPRPIITNKVSHKREALHGEGLNCCLGTGRLDWIGLNWGSALAGWAGQKGGGLVGNVGR